MKIRNAFLWENFQSAICLSVSLSFCLSYLSCLKLSSCNLIAFNPPLETETLYQPNSGNFPPSHKVQRTNWNKTSSSSVNHGKLCLDWGNWPATQVLLCDFLWARWLFATERGCVTYVKLSTLETTIQLWSWELRAVNQGNICLAVNLWDSMFFVCF